MNANLFIRGGIVIAVLGLVGLVVTPIAVATEQPAGGQAPSQKEMTVEKQHSTLSGKLVQKRIEPAELNEMKVPERIVRSQEPRKLDRETREILRILDEKSAASF